MHRHRKNLNLFLAPSLLLVPGLLCPAHLAVALENAQPVQLTAAPGNALAGNAQSTKPIALSPTQVKATGSGKIKFENGGIHLQFSDPSWDSGFKVTPAGNQATWDLSAWKVLAVDVENLSKDSQMRLLMEVAAGQGKENIKRTNVGIGLNPGEKRTMRLLLPHRWKYASPEGVPGVRTIDTTEVSSIVFMMQWPFEKARPGLLNCRVTNLRTEEALTPTAPIPADTYAPFIDEYGQFMHADWPEKIHSAADLRKNYLQEQQELDAAHQPEQWDQYGGWKNGPQLKATGSFRTEKYNGKWYFVDPEGRLFISQGLDVINHGTEALKVLPGKENWFKTLPPGAKSYYPTDVSLKQKYGKDDYQADYFENVVKRMKAWGFNTIGDWSSLPLMSLGKTPYTLQLTDYDWKMPRIEGSKLKFYDVFDPTYIKKMETLIPTLAAKDPLVAKSLTDPMCIGYFIDNELNFGNRGRMTLVDDILKSPAKQVAKQEFVNDLKLKYTTIEKLNTSWGTRYADWNALLASTEVPTSKGYRDDAQVFFLKAVDQYFRMANLAVKSVAPQRLYLGARFISTDAVRPALYDACKKYSDLLTVNIYAHSAANFPVEGLPDMPVLVTEFQFGILQRGMLSASLCQAGVTPEDRAMAYTRFMQGVLVHPNMVGAHWFQFRDQPLTGRGDGEAYQIGFVDVTDTPYTAMTRASRLIGENMYRYRMNGQLVNEMAPAKKN